jgi:hypothetical protein
MRIVCMFRRLLVVATGSGIGPCAPHIFDQKTVIKVLWTAPNVRETFGDKLVDQILAAAPDSVIYGGHIKLKSNLLSFFLTAVAFQTHASTANRTWSN